MKVIEDGQLKGSFKGFKYRDTVFKFVGGGKWRQNQYRYHYHYAYMPHAKVMDDRGRFMLYVESIDEPVEVKRA